MSVTRPWEDAQGQRPWETAAAVIYARTVAIHRPTQDLPVRQVSYQGETTAAESIIMTGLPASIQKYRTGRSIKADLPADVTGRGEWSIFLPASAAALGSIQRNDIAIDDLGTRYQVKETYWNILGYRLDTEQAEV